MDAVPGLPTSFIFTPVLTTQEFRQQLSKYPEWQVPADPADPTGPKKWETFEYELACAELCGKGHYSMRRIVEVVTREEFDTWLVGQKSFYGTNIRGTKADPWAGKKVFGYEKKARASELNSEVSAYLNDTTGTANAVLPMKFVSFDEKGMLQKEVAATELDVIAEILAKNPSLKMEVHVLASTAEEWQAMAGQISDYLAAKGANDVVVGGMVPDPASADKKSGVEFQIISK
jgi:cytochrome c oxidase subunit 2